MNRDEPAPTKATPPPSRRTSETQAREAERKARLAAELRRNLKRRKGPEDRGQPDGDAQ